MERLKAYALEKRIPIVRDKTSKYLIEEIKKKNPKNILEIGSAIGYSGLLMLKNCEGKLTTIEKDVDRFNEAKLNFEKYQTSSRTNLILGDALEEIEKLDKRGEKFDFIFLDGAKGQYIKYLPILKNMLKSGGVLFADNVDLLGLVNHPELVNHKNRTMTRNMKMFLENLENDEDFDTKIYHIDDGFSISVKKCS